MPPALRLLVPSYALLCLLCAANVAHLAQAQASDAGYFFAAARAFDEGRYEDALLSLASGPENPESRYLAARNHAALGKYKEALAAFSEVPESFPQGVRDDFLSLRAEWAAAAGLCAKLNAWADALPKERRARLSAECAFREGDFAAATSALDGMQDLASRSLYAQAVLKSGKPEQAASLARNLWIEAPAHGDAALWASMAEKHTPGLTLNTSQHMTRAEGWLAAHRAQEAIAELRDLPEPSSKPERARLWHLRGEAFYKARNRYPESTKAFDKAAKLAGPTEAYDAFHAVRALSRAGSDRKAIPRYEKFAKAYPKSSYAGDAMYLAAWLSARENLKGADRKLQAFVSSAVARAEPGLRRTALWDLAWLAIKAEKHRDAQRWLAEIPDVSETLLNGQRSYWRAHSLLAAGERTQAIEVFKEALLADPLGWYAQLAARRLIDLGEAAPAAYAGTPEPLAQPTLSPPDDVSFYRRLGLYADAARASERWGKTLKDRLLVTAAHSASGDATQAHAAAQPWLSSLFKSAPSPDNTWLWRAAFPMPYTNLVRAETESRGLPTTLFYGHMQVESRYKPAVVSGADAIGLMQLLPSTAQSVAKGLGLSIDRASLKRPAQNIPLGASYLSGLLKRYQGQYPLAIAAYNAGTRRVDGWLSPGCPCALDRWVEEIPVAQTRNYVRRVVSAWARYHALSNPEDPWGVELPAQVMPPTK